MIFSFFLKSAILSLGARAWFVPLFENTHAKVNFDDYAMMCGEKQKDFQFSFILWVLVCLRAWHRMAKLLVCYFCIQYCWIRT